MFDVSLPIKNPRYYIKGEAKLRHLINHFSLQGPAKPHPYGRANPPPTPAATPVPAMLEG